MIRPLAILAALACCSTAVPASAGFPVQIDKVCPVGGKKFKHTTTGSYTIFGSRPDGKPFGSWTFPLAIPECPDNGLVMYRDFEKNEIAKLTKLVASKEYRALRDETSYYRAAWLAERMDADEPLSPIWLLMRAAWQVDHDAVTKARYQTEFAERAGAVPLDGDQLNTLFLRYRVANAHRELGAFDKAKAALDSLTPELIEKPATAGTIETYEQRRDQESRRALLEMIPRLRGVIETQDRSADPIAMKSARDAMWECKKLQEEGVSALPARCGDVDVKEELAKQAAKTPIQVSNGEADTASDAADAAADAAAAVAEAAEAAMKERSD